MKDLIALGCWAVLLFVVCRFAQQFYAVLDTQHNDPIRPWLVLVAVVVVAAVIGIANAANAGNR